jgi:hypothetical protein
VYWRLLLNVAESSARPGDGSMENTQLSKTTFHPSW